MTNSLFRNLQSDGMDRIQRRQTRTRTRSMREAAQMEDLRMEDGFYWHRIRRMSKKG